MNLPHEQIREHLRIYDRILNGLAENTAKRGDFRLREERLSDISMVRQNIKVMFQLLDQNEFEQDHYYVLAMINRNIVKLILDKNAVLPPLPKI